MCLIKNRNNRNNIWNLLVQFQFTYLILNSYSAFIVSPGIILITLLLLVLCFSFSTEQFGQFQNSRTEWWWRMRKGVDMYVYVFRSWWECTNDIQIYFCKSLSSLTQSNDSSNQNNNYFSGRRESPSKKDMKTKDFFHGQNERVIFTFQRGVSKHTVST